MNQRAERPNATHYDDAEAKWQDDYSRDIGDRPGIHNRSGVRIRPLYGPAKDPGVEHLDRLGLPGQVPYTRGIYPTMHRGRTWSQRQLIGQGTPDEYNQRVLKMIEAGATAISLIPCNSVYRGHDCDEVPLPLLGTCGTVVNTVAHMDNALSQNTFKKWVQRKLVGFITAILDD